MENAMTWEELLVMGGFKFTKDNYTGRIRMNESEENLAFLKEILADCCYETPATVQRVLQEAPPNVGTWRVMLKKHGGRPSELLFPSDRISLRELDVPILGIVGQLNAMGYHTAYSCSGHGNAKATIGFDSEACVSGSKRLFRDLGLDVGIQSRRSLVLHASEDRLFDLGIELYRCRTAVEREVKSIILERRLGQLEELLGLKGSSGEEYLVREYIMEKFGPVVDTIKSDGYGNVLAEKRFGDGNTILLSAHMDVVASDINPDSEIIKTGPIWKRKSGILGADDRAGIAIIMNILKELKPRDFTGTLKIAFTVEEEIGQYGAENIDNSFFDDIDCAISLDRRHASDIVTRSGYQDYCSPEFGQFFERVSRGMFGPDDGYRCVQGGISDLRVWSEQSVDSVNLSVGFYNEHTSGEYLNVQEWERTLEFVKACLRRLAKISKENGWHANSVCPVKQPVR
jgi:hypothetical protein